MKIKKKKRQGIPLWVVILFFFACIAVWRIWSVPLGQASPSAVAEDCRSQLKRGWKYLRYFIQNEKKDEAPPSDWTVQDLIQETDYPIFMSCPVHFLQENFGKKRQGYLVFPVSASLVFDESLQPPVPIIMDLPGAHKKYGTNVLYSDGTVQVLTTRVAEKLVAEQHPVPLELKKPDFMTGRDAEP